MVAKPDLNIIIVVLDSLRQDHVGFYRSIQGFSSIFDGVKPPETPNLDRLASESVVFTNAYPSGLPTIPVREELLTGQFTLPYHPWSPMHPDSYTMPELLKGLGYLTGLISDTYHLFKPGMNYTKGFDTWLFIRGQEYDAYGIPPPVNRKLEDYVTKDYYTNYAGSRSYAELVAQFLANIDDWRGEEDWFAARVFRAASEWVRRAYKSGGRFMLWVDSFDPHEPWIPPPRFDKYTDPGYKGPKLIMPMGGEASKWFTEEQVNYIRGLYAGEVAYVDHYFGEFYNTLRDLGLLEQSIIILLADHGHPLADHGKFLKGGDRLYNELLKVPFMVRLPNGRHMVTNAIVQFPDLLPTILELLGLPETYTYTLAGRSFTSVLNGSSNSHRRYAIMGYHEAVDRCIRDGEWSLVYRPDGRHELYNIKKDPKERINLINEYPDKAEELLNALALWFMNRRIPIRQIQARYELGGTGKA